MERDGETLNYNSKERKRKKTETEEQNKNCSGRRAMTAVYVVVATTVPTATSSSSSRQQHQARNSNNRHDSGTLSKHAMSLGNRKERQRLLGHPLGIGSIKIFPQKRLKKTLQSMH
ncbi:uncharacterized protein LOC108118369 [Drosophila eugracilis]|uniref:uncharacterized protein LOC108118369 n=1 Tax=Drosophila eugracilis TaxID=29029 RepID=UPI001BDA7832|nr:uncharacterized protein LOC108118369 [Drosophila eugracilis]